MENQLSLDELREKFHAIWLKSSGWRLELGEVLYQIKTKCEHGAWGEFLFEYDLARSTADDYIRLYKEKAQIAEIRQFDEPSPELAPDPEAEARAEAIEIEKQKRTGKERQHNPTEIRVKLKNLRPDQTSDYWEERKANPARVEQLWQRTLLMIIRADEVLYPPPLEIDPDEGTFFAKVQEKEELCTPS
jgi:hypothetical protein